MNQPKQTPVFLTETELADRWKISTKTLQNWRVTGGGPRVNKIGYCVRYSMAEIERYEQETLFASTSEATVSART